MATSQGLNQFEHEHEAEIEFVEVGDRGVVSSFNTPEEFVKLKSNFKQ